MDNLKYLVYTSVAVQIPSNEDIDEIVQVSRVNNLKSDITGLLHYRNGYFVQFIEGPPAAICDLLERLRRDRRHRNIHVIEETFIAARNFSGWTMAHGKLDEELISSKKGSKQSISSMFSTAGRSVVDDSARVVYRWFLSATP
ncbi:BLUF domain-containing protein [Corynebacterium variabile]|uniref:BLUF domain-containing protein n=1 Tax=Corynebacterium variabile TaxID=1727 RepID=UPI0028AB5FA4|nr:BLUF domain-containing protein [Corynebacterium variabile]